MEESVRTCAAFLRAHRNDYSALTVRFFEPLDGHLPAVQSYAFEEHGVYLCLPTANQQHDQLLSQVSFWEPLLREIEGLQNIESLTIKSEPPRHLFPLFRQLFQVFQRSHPNIKTLSFVQVEFCSENSEPIALYLENEPSNLNDLEIEECAGDASRIVAGLRQNKHLRSLTLNSSSLEICANIFQGLAAESDGRPSCLQKIVCRGFDIEFDSDLVGPFVQASEALQEYLESPNATIQHLKFTCCFWHRIPGVSKFVQGLIRNTSVTAVEFVDCNSDNHGYDDDSDDDDGDSTLVPYHLGQLVRNKPNLSSLSIWNCNFFQCQSFTDAVLEALACRSSPLRSLALEIADMNCGGYVISLEAFRALMNGVANNTRLSRLELSGFDVDYDLQYLDDGEIYLWTVAEFLPSFSIEELHMRFQRTPEREQAELDQDEARLLEAFKNNYSLQRVECTSEEQPWFNGANQARLEFYLERNRKLARWTENPKLVPRDLWPEAIMLALAAGKDPLYRSLLALSEQENGLRQRGRKRKRPQCYKP